MAGPSPAQLLISALTQLAGSELSSSVDLRNSVAGMASSAPSPPRTYAQKISEMNATVPEMPTASPVNRGWMIVCTMTLSAV